MIERFHSINVPSEWGQSKKSGNPMSTVVVSIQLMSPASGDQSNYFSFASHLKVSIQLMSPASGDSCGTGKFLSLCRFHSINVPSEWGLSRATKICIPIFPSVSIQLMSPASGDKKVKS
jgi:hypothetical protein